MAKVLVTGAAGAIGRPVCRELLARGFEVRAFDRVITPGVDDVVVADLTDRHAVREAVRGVDIVVHLAAEPNDAAFEDLVPPNVIGLFNIMDAARDEGVQRMALASSIQVNWGRRDRDRPVSVEEASPGNHYALTKVWAEKMAEMYVRRFEMSIVAVRVAWMVRNPAEAARMEERQLQRLFLSARDVARCFACAIEAPNVEFAVVFAVGPAGCASFDMEPARRLIGFEPKDYWPDGLDFEWPLAP